MSKDRVRKPKKHKLILRNLTIEDYDQIAALMDQVYGNLGGAWNTAQYAAQLTAFLKAKSA